MYTILRLTDSHKNAADAQTLYGIGYSAAAANEQLTGTQSSGLGCPVEQVSTSWICECVGDRRIRLGRAVVSVFHLLLPGVVAPLAYAAGSLKHTGMLEAPLDNGRLGTEGLPLPGW